MVLKASVLQDYAVASCSKDMIAPRGVSIRTLQCPCNFSTQSTSCTTRASPGHCRIVASKASHRQPICSIVPLPKQKALLNQVTVDFYQKSSFPERWVEDSICEIVKHRNEAPYLQFLFKSEDDSTTLTSKSQRVPVGNWLTADERWNETKSQVSKASPDGIILVHHLQGNSLEDCFVEDEVGTDKLTTRAAIDKTRSVGKDLWGILILGRAIAESACYILETTSVSSPFGTCTSFCLTKAQSFGSSWHEQMQSSWLLKTDIN